VTPITRSWRWCWKPARQDFQRPRPHPRNGSRCSWKAVKRALRTLSTLAGSNSTCHYAINLVFSQAYGGDGGARTRDLCRDSGFDSRNLLKLPGTDGSNNRIRAHIGTVIVPLSCAHKPLP